MNGKKPISVLMDGYALINKAIRKVLFEVRHRLCSWHLNRNVKTNVKCTKYISVFANSLKNKMVVHEFEYEWSRVVSEYGLQDNEWVQNIYRMRSL